MNTLDAVGFLQGMDIEIWPRRLKGAKVTGSGRLDEPCEICGVKGQTRIVETAPSPATGSVLYFRVCQSCLVKLKVVQ